MALIPAPEAFLYALRFDSYPYSVVSRISRKLIYNHVSSYPFSNLHNSFYLVQKKLFYSLLFSFSYVALSLYLRFYIGIGEKSSDITNMAFLRGSPVPNTLDTLLSLSFIPTSHNQLYPNKTSIICAKIVSNK